MNARATTVLTQLLGRFGAPSGAPKLSAELRDKIGSIVVLVLRGLEPRVPVRECAAAIAATLTGAALLTDRPQYDLGERELAQLEKRLKKRRLKECADRLRPLAERSEWFDVYYIALRALREADLA